MERSTSQAPGAEHSTGELVKMMTEQMSVLIRVKADVEEIKERRRRET